MCIDSAKNGVLVTIGVIRKLILRVTESRMKIIGESSQDKTRKTDWKPFVKYICDKIDNSLTPAILKFVYNKR